MSAGQPCNILVAINAVFARFHFCFIDALSVFDGILKTFDRHREVQNNA